MSTYQFKNSVHFNKTSFKICVGTETVAPIFLKTLVAISQNRLTPKLSWEEGNTPQATGHLSRQHHSD